MKDHGEIYEFGVFRLEVRERRLLKGGEPVPLRAKVFDTLRVLIENSGRLVSKDELMEAVWPDAVVEEGNLAHNVTALRKALGDRDGGQQHVETVPGRGYRFTAAVFPAEAAGVESAGRSWEERLEAARAALARKCSARVIEPAAELRTVGRTRELAELLSGLDRTIAGRSGVYCVTGEPGIGKSTLFDQFLSLDRSRRSNCVAAIGRCSEQLGQGGAYLPVLEALDSLFAGLCGQEIRELMLLTAPTWFVQVAPLWASGEPSFPAVLADAKTASRERMMRELASFFEEVARIVPLVLFLDDLHWADASTTELLAYLARRLPSARMMLIVAYRPSDLVLENHPFVALQQELARQDRCREIPVALLTETDVESYLRLELPRETLPGGLAEFIHQRTEGNPLFMTELVRQLRESEDASFREHDVPESVRSMIQRRVDRLSDEELALLAGAAIQGWEFESRILADALGWDAAAIEERLIRLDRVHSFVRRIQEKELPDASLSVTYRFTHVLYQHAIAENLAPSRRAALSKATAEALLARNRAHLAPLTSRLALLFETAREFDQAADYFIAAAANATRLYANEEAVSLSRRAIENAHKLQGLNCHSRVAAAATQVAQLQMVLSRFGEAALDFSVAEQAAKAAGDVDSEVNAICGGALALFYQRKMDETREMAARALEIAQSAQSECAVASAEAVLGLERMCFGATQDAEERFDRSTAILIRRGPNPQALEAITFSGLLRAWQLEYNSSYQTVNWTLQRSRDVGLPYHIVLNLFVRGMTLFNQGRLSEGIRDLQEGMQLAEKNRERYWLSRYPNTLGWVHRELQDVETALRFDAEGARIAREHGYGKPEANSHVNLAQDYMDVGETPRALEHLNRATEIFEADVWFRWRYNIRTQSELARYWLLRGDTVQARKCALETVALAEPHKARKYLPWAHKILGDIAMAEDRVTDARQEYDRALGLLQRHRCPLIEWRVLFAAGQAAAPGRKDQYQGKCRQVIHGLAESISEEKLRRQFLDSEAIRKALSS